MDTGIGGTGRDFIEIMRERGFLHQCTDEAGLSRLLADGPATAFVGFDATADSLHVGHLVSLMALRWFMRTGNRGIALMGGATTMLGDPSFRNDARPMLAPEDIRANAGRIEASVRAVLSGAGQPTVVDNSEWLGAVGLVEFMRDVGAHFSVPRMLAMDSVRSRLGDGGSLSMLEFTYMLLQSADFVELSRRFGCRLQMGGSDQWGNICNGVDLSRRKGGSELFGLTVPLLVTASGTKMGKTASGAVWLSSDRLDPFAFRQFWRNVDDADTGRFLALFTELPMDEVRRLGALSGSEANAAKEVLADAVTGLVHGVGAAAEAAARASDLFSGGSDVTHRIDGAGVRGLADLVVLAGLAPSRGEARRLVAAGAVRIGGRKAEGDALGDVAAPIRLSVGKRRAAVVELV